MTPNLEEITKHLEKTFDVSDVIVKDDSHFHTSHSNYQQQKAYLTVIIPHKPSVSRIAYHRMIYQAVNEICNLEVHALSIQLV